jgi:hypothetical protein
MLDSVKKLSRGLVAGLALSITLYGSASPARTSPEAVRPYLCESTVDGSAVGYRNVKGSSLIYVGLAAEGDTGGALIHNLTPISGNTGTFSVNVLPTDTTANLRLTLLVSASKTKGSSETVSLNPTSIQTAGSINICNFEFSQYGFPAGTNINDIAVQVTPTGSESGSLYLYKCTVNGTIITNRIIATGGCL